MANDKYILDGHTPILEPDLIKWARWFEDAQRTLTAKRTVGLTVKGDVKISTVFLGCDHSFGGSVPILFETMIFEGEGAEYKGEEYQERYATWDEAVAGHKRAVALVEGDNN